MSPKSVNELRNCILELTAVNGRTDQDQRAVEFVKAKLELLIQRYGAGARSGWTEEGR